MSRRHARWRSFGAAFYIAGGLAAVVGAAESLLADPGGLPTLRETLYTVDLHLLGALVVVFLLRWIAWKSSEKTFPLLCLAVVGLLEGGLVAGTWLHALPVGRNLYGLRGTLALGAAMLLGAAVGLLPALLTTRRISHAGRLRLTRGVPGPFGILAAAALLIINVPLAWQARPRSVSFETHASTAAPGSDDVILIVVDALRRDHLSSFGYPRPTSPNIDRLLGESWTFTNAYAPATETRASLAALLTGRYPSWTAPASGAGAAGGDALLAERFRRRGYATGAFVTGALLDPDEDLTRGFEIFHPRTRPWWGYRGRTAFERIAERLRRPAPATAGWEASRQALKWLRTHQERPRFLFLLYDDPAAPYEPWKGDRAAVAPEAPPGPRVPPAFPEEPAEGVYDWESLSGPPQPSGADLEGMVANYDAEVHHLDRCLGELLASLEQMGVLDHAHLILCSDHGQEFGDHGGWDSGRAVYEETAACLLAYRPPGGLPEGGARIARPVAMLDLLRTLDAHLGLPSSRGRQGRILPELRSGAEGPAQEPAVLCEAPPALYALRMRQWKLIRRGPRETPEWRLYDLATDPREHDDLADAQPDTLAVMRAQLEEELAPSARAMRPPVPPAGSAGETAD